MRPQRFKGRILSLAAGAGGLIALLAGPFLGGAHAEPLASVAGAVAPSQPWAQTQSDVPADPAVRFGILPNGMRYAIVHNATPPDHTELMLRIDAGSLMEAEDQRGLAHFLEHMVFNGTTHMSKNELIHALERMGLAFGADLNAGTGMDETVYQLNLPRSDDEMLSNGLYVLREQVSEATITKRDVMDERGVVEGEERARNTPASRVGEKELKITARGLKIADRRPIGDMKIIASGPQQRIADFYRAYYRPSRATLIAVGDFDAVAMEAKVRAKFADWKPKGPEGPEPELGQVAAHGPETHVFVESGVSSRIALTWTKRPDLRLDSIAYRREKTLRLLALQVLNRRLQEMSDTDEPPFLQANASEGDAVRSLGFASIEAQFVPGGWKRALEAIDAEQRRFVQYGVTDAELQREIDALRTRAKEAVVSASTRTSAKLASELIASVNERSVFDSPESKLARFEATVKGLMAADVNAAAKTIFDVGNPLTLVMTPKPIEGGEAVVAAALDAAQRVAVSAPQSPVKLPWPYTNFGSPTRVVSRTEIVPLGATVITFANGVVLTVKHTDFAKDSISIVALTGNGELSFSPDRIDPQLELLLPGTTLGGLGKLNRDEISRSLNGHVYSAGLNVVGNKVELTGGTRRADLQLEMQVLAAYLIDPAFRSAPLEKIKAVYPMMLETKSAVPGGAFDLASREILAGGDKRKAFPTADEVASWPVDDLRPGAKALLAKGAIHITMVGDLSVDEAIAAVASTFGALPPRPPLDPPVAGAETRHFPGPTAEPLRFTHTGIGEQGLGFVAWPTTDEVDSLAESRRVRLMAAVVRLRALDEIREHLALAYSPNVGAEFSDVYRGYGFIDVQAQTAPGQLPNFFKAVDGIAQSLRDKPISDDELKRARAPMIESIRHAMNTNLWWKLNLTNVVDRPRIADEMLTEISVLEKVTPADIQAMARKYLRPDTAWRAEVTPSAGATVSDGWRPESGDSSVPAADPIKVRD